MKNDDLKNETPTFGNVLLCEGVITETKLEWKMFLRKNGRWSIWHLCDKDNKCKCGWEYKKKEFTKVKAEKEMPDFAVCNFCVKGIADESIIRMTDVF
jgi:hypothetical protein